MIAFIPRERPLLGVNQERDRVERHHPDQPTVADAVSNGAIRPGTPGPIRSHDCELWHKFVERRIFSVSSRTVTTGALRVSGERTQPGATNADPSSNVGRIS